jgi:allophanate hydrolase subunit 2
MAMKFILQHRPGIRNYIALRGGIAVEQVLKVPVMTLWLTMGTKSMLGDASIKNAACQLKCTD